MAPEHFIAGKDASLEASLRHMQRTLTQLGFHLEERAWLHPVHGIWSVHVCDRDCPILFTNGKGTSRAAALASALGEFFERLACNYFWSHYDLGPAFATHDFTHFPQERWFSPGKKGQWPKAILTPELHAFYNPDKRIDARLLVDFNSGNATRGICALPFTRVADGCAVWFPVSLLGNLYVSNGMAAGNTETEARTQALSEIIERHVKFRVLREGLCLPEVPQASVARFPSIAAGLGSLRKAGFGISVRDASLGGRYPVMAIVLMNPNDQGCYASFGAHPCCRIALERALTELLQGRALDALTGFPEPGFDLDEVADPANLEIHFVDSSGVLPWHFVGTAADFDYCDWNFSAPGTHTADDYAWLVDRIHAENHEIYIADYPHLGVYACRILVPGFSEIYPVEDLEHENTGIGIPLREAILSLSSLKDAQCAALLETLYTTGLADERPVAALIGLAADAGTFWEDLRVGELKTLLALAIGDEEATLEGCDWIRQFAQIDPDRRLVYRCIESRLRLAGEGMAHHCRDALKTLYGTHVLAQADALIDRRERFFGIEAPGAALKGCLLHARLLDAYARIHPRKTQGKPA